MLIFTHNEEADPLIRCHRCTNTRVSRVNTDKSSCKKKKKKEGTVPTLDCLFSPCFYTSFIFSPAEMQSDVPAINNKKKRERGVDDRKNNTDSCNSPGGKSFCLAFIQTAGGWGPLPEAALYRFPGRWRKDGRRVPTTLLNRSHRSLLVGHCITAERRHFPSSAGRCTRLQGGGSETFVPDTSTKRRVRRKVTSEFHSPLSYLKM